MNELLEDRVPRSAELVERLLGPMSKRVERGARIVLIVVGVITVFVAGIALATTDRASFGDTATLMGMFAVFVGFVPWLGVRWYLLRDVRIARKLLLHGEARVPSALAESPHNTMAWLDAIWEDEGQTYFVRIDGVPSQLDSPDVKEVIVISSPRSNYAAVMLGRHGLFVGQRRRSR